MKNIEDNYRNKKWFSLNNLADFIAEYNKDGKYDKSAWGFWEWLDEKCNKKYKFIQSKGEIEKAQLWSLGKDILNQLEQKLSE